MHKKIFFPSVIIFLALLVYVNSFSNDFVWDDEFLIKENELIRDIGDIGNWHKIITQELQDRSKTNYYRPIQVFSYMLDYSMYKLRPFGYHLINFILHILNAILVYVLLSRLTSQPVSQSKNTARQTQRWQDGKTARPTNLIPLFTALFFVVHPVHTESVSYISGRADLLAGFFMLLALFLYIRHFDATRFKKMLYLSSILLFSLALFSKEMSLIFPVILIIYEYFFVRQEKAGLRHSLSSRIKRVLPFLLLACFYIILRLSILNFSSPYFWTKANLYSVKNITIRFLSFLKGTVLYLRLLVMPMDLYMERYIAPATKIIDPYVLIFILMSIASAIMFRISHIKNKQFVLFGIIWFIVFLLPQSNFFFPFILADHFLYLPSIGIFLIAAYGVNSLYIQRKQFALVLFISIVGFLGLLTFSQNYVWRNPLTFYRWIDKFSQFSYVGRNNLANIYAYLGRDDLAIEKYEQAFMINPNIESIRKNISLVEYNLIKKYKDALKSRPTSSVHHYNLAYLYERKGRFDEAISYYAKAIEIDPKFVEAISNLGNVYEKTDRPDEALLKYKKAISIDPQFAKGYFNIGVVLANQDKLEQAQSYFKQALGVDPDYQKAKDYLDKISRILKEPNAP